MRRPRTLRTATRIMALFCILTGPASVGALGAGLNERMPPRARMVPEAKQSQVVRQDTGSVRGVVFDSLTMAPAAKVLVWLPGTSHITTADSSGRFSLNGIPAGAHFIAFSSPALDSLGLGALGGNATVRPNQTTDASLTTPGFRTIARALCGDTETLSNNTGIVWGTVRDALTSIHQSGARASFVWRDLAVGADKQVHSNEVTRDFRTDSTAMFYACGLPTDVTLLTHADGARAASGVVQIMIGARRLRRMDLLVSTDMVVTETMTSSSTIDAGFRPRGAVTVRGVVTNENGVPVANADVALASVDTSVRTSSTGEFVLGGLPGGTHDMVVRRVGVAPLRMVVDLKVGEVDTRHVTLPSTQLLEKIDVVADNTATTADRLDYETRRKAGFGYAFDEKAFKNHESLATVLQGAVPSANIQRSGNSVAITMKRISMSGGSMECSPVIWEDGRRSGPQALEYPIEHYRATEIFPRATSAPAMYVGLNQSCGVVLVWTKFARW